MFNGLLRYTFIDGQFCFEWQLLRNHMSGRIFTLFCRNGGLRGVQIEALFNIEYNDVIERSVFNDVIKSAYDKALISAD